MDKPIIMLAVEPYTGRTLSLVELVRAIRQDTAAMRELKDALLDQDSPSQGPVTQKYKIEVEQESDGRWIAEIPDVPGALAYGSTEEVAIAAVEDLVLSIRDQEYQPPKILYTEIYCDHPDCDVRTITVLTKYGTPDRSKWRCPLCHRPAKFHWERSRNRHHGPMRGRSI